MKFSPKALLAVSAFALVVPVLGVGTPPGASLPSADAAVKQTGKVALLPQIVQPGAKAASPNKARVSVKVQFKPARKGRPVLIQRRLAGGSWQKVTTLRQNKAGAVSFTAAASKRGKSFAFRGVAKRFKGLKKVASNSASRDLWSREFNDEFSGTTLGSQWTNRVTNAPSRQCSKTGDPRASAVGGGVLKLSVIPDPDRSGTCSAGGGSRYYLNGQVGTQHVPHAFTRGVFAARMKFQRNRGQHGSFWLQPVRPQYIEGNPSASGAEIDIVEFFGQGYKDGGLASFLYNYGIDGGNEKIGGLAPKATAMLPSTDAWWKNYHVFSLEWTPTSYIFRVDGREHYRTSRGVSGIDEYLILSLLSSDWELAEAKKLGITPGGSMYVDWVRVWQR